MRALERSRVEFRQEVLVSTKLIAGLFLAAGASLVMLSHKLPIAHNRDAAAHLAGLLYAMAAVAYLVNRFNPDLSRWFSIIALLMLVHIASRWLREPTLLILIVIPLTLSLLTLDTKDTLLIALAETALLLAVPQYVAVGAKPVIIVVALVNTWGSLAVAYALHRVAWLFWENQRDMAELLREARTQNVGLKETLDSWAHLGRQLALANERVSALRLVAEEAVKAKTTFLSRVSHEFRTPLNMIIGLVGLILEHPEIYAEEILPELREDLEIVYRNCRHLSSMVDDILDLTRAEAGRFSLHREWVDLREIVDESVEAVRPLAERKGLDLRIAAAPDDLPEVYCDRTRIRQVLLNLLSNAARYTIKGRISVRIEKQERRIIVSVSDTGPGMSPEDAAMIFEPFSQARSSLGTEGGSGLGLSISRQLLKLHGGRIWLQSQLGVGTTFYFDLPISPYPRHAMRAARWISENWEYSGQHFAKRPHQKENLTKPRVVLCDETGELYAKLAPYSGIEIVNTQDLDQACSELAEYPAHAIILNAASPDDLRSLVEDAKAMLFDIPIIGCHVPPQTRHAIEAGALAYLTKPITLADLQAVIDRVGKPVKRILVVDDDPEFLQLVQRMLAVCEGVGEIYAATNGEQALAMMREALPNLALIDIMLPDMDGWQLADLKRRDDLLRDIPFVFMSARDITDQPLSIQQLVATMDGGLSPQKLLDCTLELSKVLLNPGT